MKFAKLLHNPDAGDGEHSAENLVDLIKAEGFECEHESVKAVDGSDIKAEEIDFVVVAGGDGTVRKIAKHLIKENLPIGLLPMGTANNIAKTLGIKGETEDIIRSWKDAIPQAFDVGKIYGLAKRKFFIEGVGFGVFPKLMREMRKRHKNSIQDPEDKLKTALALLKEIVENYEAKSCSIEIDGITYSGKFLLAEVMNTKSIGPNLNLAPIANPGDGMFEVVLIQEERREDFLKYLAGKIDGNEELTFFKTIKTNKVEMFWKGCSLHIDDEDIKLDKPQKLEIQLQKGALRFLIPALQ